MFQNVCKKCGSHDFFIETSGNNTGLYCSSCGKWMKWLGKNEIKVFNNSKTNVKSDKSKLYELLHLVTENENRYYEYATEAMKQNNMMANQIHSAQAGAFQQVRYTIEDMLKDEM